MGDDTLFNPLTRNALRAHTGEYISKDMDEYALIEELKSLHGLDRVYRFDIGKNTDGFSPLIRETLDMTDIPGEAVRNLIEYPDNQYRQLKKWIANFYDIRPQWFVLSAGLEPMLDMIARVFLAPFDAYLLPVPNFFHFEEYSTRLGARPVMIRLREEEGFQWTSETIDEVCDAMAVHVPKMLWISNPGNPTGAWLDHAGLEIILHEAERNDVVVVVDEAYGEYTDLDAHRRSACSVVERHPRLLVLRTFSKIYGLPSLRVGYCVCSSADILEAITMYRPMFPFSWFSLYVAQIAAVDQEFVAESRAVVQQRRSSLFAGLDALHGFEHTRSETNIFLLRHASVTAEELCRRLLPHGIIVADHNDITGIAGRQYVRVTVRSDEDNAVLLRALRREFAS